MPAKIKRKHITSGETDEHVNPTSQFMMGRRTSATGPCSPAQQRLILLLSPLSVLSALHAAPAH